jgi:hypothetical protein
VAEAAPRVDAETGRIVASALTSKDVDDGTQVGPLLDQVTDPVASFTGDGAYDQDAVYATVAERHPDAAVIVPPRTTAVPSGAAETAPTQRDRHLPCITEKGRMACGECQASCRTAYVMTFVYAAPLLRVFDWLWSKAAWTTASRSGLSVTAAIGVQFRV